MRVVLSVLAAIVICASLYFGYFAIAGDSNQRFGQVRQRGFERQTTLIDGAQTAVAEAESLSDGPQRTAIINQACRQITRIDNPPADLAAFDQREC